MKRFCELKKVGKSRRVNMLMCLTGNAEIWRNYNNYIDTKSEDYLDNIYMYCLYNNKEYYKDVLNKEA